jgi:hypothetical protein
VEPIAPRFIGQRVKVGGLEPLGHKLRDVAARLGVIAEHRRPKRHKALSGAEAK